MSANTPIVKRMAWTYTLPHLLLMSGLVLLFWKILGQFKLALAYTALSYLIYSFGSKAIILNHHKRGISLIKLGLFRDAIDEFRQSYSFLTKHTWLDKYRVITMLDSSAIPYREMAVCNIAFSHLQLGEAGEAERHYRKALEEFPESECAKSGLEHIQTQQKTD